MTVVGYNAAMHAASVLGQLDRALELLEEMKVRASVKQRLVWSFQGASHLLARQGTNSEHADLF